MTPFWIGFITGVTSVYVLSALFLLLLMDGTRERV